MNIRFLGALFACVVALLPLRTHAQSFLVLGDVHYDLLEDHDLDWLRKKGDDYRQVTQEYVPFTAKNWPVLAKRLRQQAVSHRPDIKAVLQLGDWSEGLAGNPEKAMQMARSAMKAIEDLQMPVPWVLIKGNHDITGPGAKEAFAACYLPMIRKQLQRDDIRSANYAHRIGQNLFVCCDPWDKQMLDFLEETLEQSDARFKFVLVHEPVIPVNERCWHLFRREPEKRERLLRILAQNQAIVLTAHLHLFSVVKRETAYGPIVQVMCNSVVRDPDQNASARLFTRYGSCLATDRPDWEPDTMDERVKWLDEETPYVTYFQQQDLPGYGILTTDSLRNDVWLEYYTPEADAPYQRLCLSDLQKPDVAGTRNGQWAPWYIIQVSDTQLGFISDNRSTAEETALFEEACRKINRLQPDLVVMTGDFVNSSRNESQLLQFKTLCSKLSTAIRLYKIPGNHDLGDSRQPANRAFYNLLYGPDHFATIYKGVWLGGINTCLLKDSVADLESRQYDWLTRELADSRTAKVHLLFGHHPFCLSDMDEAENYSNLSRPLRQRYSRLMGKYHVSHYFAGHLHDNRLVEHDGITYVTTSALGRQLGQAQPGVRVIRICGDTVEHRYLGVDELPGTRAELDRLFTGK